MRIYLANNTSNFHAGCNASMSYLCSEIEKAGHKIIAHTMRPAVPEIEHIKNCDCMIVNGEGFMRYEVGCSWPSEESRIQRTKEAMWEALAMRKKLMLINTVWDRMDRSWRAILPFLNYISVRELSSYESMREILAPLELINPKVEINLDLSYFAPVKKTFGIVLREGIACGTFYRILDKSELRYPQISMDIGNNTPTFDQIVRYLREKELYITGQHHGVYAACRARCPFIAVKVNTHKVTGLFRWAGVNIPILEHKKDLGKLIHWAMGNKAEYKKLFDFMEAQEPWKFPVI